MLLVMAVDGTGASTGADDGGRETRVLHRHAESRGHRPVSADGVAAALHARRVGLVVGPGLLLLGGLRPDRVFLIDVDLEEPPELLTPFHEKLTREALDVVYGVQEGRKGGLGERVFGWIAWKMMAALVPIDIPRNHSTVRLMTRDYVEALIRHKERKTAIGGLMVITGFKQAGLPFTIVRPHNFYGERMGLAHVIPQLLQRIHDSADGDELVVYSIDHSRTFIHISDAVEYLVRLTLSDDAVDGTFNVGVQSPEVSIGELAELLCKVVGRDLRIVAGENHPGSPPRRCPDMTRTIGVTGHEPQVSLEQGIEETIQWVSSHLEALKQQPSDYLHQP